MQKFQTICVIGSGVMGSGIAAQVANSKTNVILLDIADKKSGDKNKIVTDSYNRLFTQKPPPLSHPSYGKYIKLGNLEHDLALVAGADLIIEVIVEKLDIKHQLYESISKYLKPTAILASNTSTLPLARLKEKLPAKIRENFVITHFFNPPRYMELVELVTDKETNKSIIQPLTDFITSSLGKTIVNCNDTPGFIANRVGCFLLELVVRRAIKENLNPQTIDQIFTSDYGFPSTGIFGLYDLIGHDVMDLISKSLLAALPKSDKYHEIYQTSEVLDRMRKENLIGRKAGGGFYKISKDASGKVVKQVINFTSLRGLSRPEAISGGLQQYYSSPSEIATVATLPRNDVVYSNFVKSVLQEFFSYVNSLIPSVTTHKDDVDKAMRLGYSLKYGPFELMRNDVIARSEATKQSQEVESNVVSSHMKLPRSRKMALSRNDGTTLHHNVFSNDSAELQLQNNNHVFVIKSKMNVLDSDVFNLLIESVRYCEDKNTPIYIFPVGNNFSAGADLRYFKNKIENKDFKTIEALLILGQKAMMALKYAKIPVIACAKGVALGGGCEILLHSSHVVAHQNLNAGLVELGVGLIPAYGGTKEMFMRSRGESERLVQNLKNIITQNKSSSADYFSLDYGVNCTVNMHKDFILEEAVSLTDGGVIPRHRPQDSEKNILHPAVKPRDDVILDLLTKLALPSPDSLQLDIINFFQKIIDKKSVTEEDLLELEREKFLELASKPLALERIEKFV